MTLGKKTNLDDETRRKSINKRLERGMGIKEETKNERTILKIRIQEKGLKTVIEELKQRMLVKSAKVKRYEQRIAEIRQNKIFDFNQKRIYRGLNRNGIKSNHVPNTEEYRKIEKFWSDICGVRKEYNKEVEWLNDLKRERERVNDKRPQERVSISVEKIRKQCRNIPK